MNLPVPRPGLVIRYAFLWSHERDLGADEAAKDRPCAIVVAAPLDALGVQRVIVAPITHLAPQDPQTSLEIPPGDCRAIGLDDGRHWVRFDELNRFAWPGFDLRPIPRPEGGYEYGMLPRALFEQLRQAILARQRAGRIRTQGRDA
jgi:hypothetical protein